MPNVTAVLQNRLPSCYVVSIATSHVGCSAIKRTVWRNGQPDQRTVCGGRPPTQAVDYDTVSSSGVTAFNCCLWVAISSETAGTIGRRNVEKFPTDVDKMRTRKGISVYTLYSIHKYPRPPASPMSFYGWMACPVIAFRLSSTLDRRLLRSAMHVEQSSYGFQPSHDCFGRPSCHVVRYSLDVHGMT